MSENLNRRFLASDSPHHYRPVSESYRLRLVVGISIIICLLISLTLIYCFIRKLIRRSSSSSVPPHHQPCNHASPRHVTLLRALPVKVYDGQNNTTTFEKDCAICLEGYKDGEKLRTLPCDHVFHCLCIDKWLLESGLCPVCRRVVVNMEEIRVENARRCSERLMATFPLRGLGGGGGQAVL